MKGILEFDLNDADDIQSHLRCTKALDLALSIWDMKQYIRSILKYQENISDDVYDQLEACQEKLNEICDEHGINLDELIS